MVVHTDHRDESETFGGRGVGVSPGNGGTGSCRITPHIGVHFEMTGNHSGTGGMPQHLLTLYWERAEFGNKPDDDAVGSGRGKLI